MCAARLQPSAQLSDQLHSYNGCFNPCQLEPRGTGSGCFHTAPIYAGGGRADWQAAVWKQRHRIGSDLNPQRSNMEDAACMEISLWDQEFSHFTNDSPEAFDQMNRKLIHYDPTDGSGTSKNTCRERNDPTTHLSFLLSYLLWRFETAVITSTCVSHSTTTTNFWCQIDSFKIIYRGDEKKNQCGSVEEVTTRTQSNEFHNYVGFLPSNETKMQVGSYHFELYWDNCLTKVTAIMKECVLSFVFYHGQ